MPPSVTRSLETIYLLHPRKYDPKNIQASKHRSSKIGIVLKYKLDTETRQYVCDVT